MKTNMERVHPLLLDLGDQNQEPEFVLFYDDGNYFRALRLDEINVGPQTLCGFVKGQIKVIIPSDCNWRFVHRDFLELVNGAVMEQMDLIGVKQRQDLKYKMLKKLGWDTEADMTKPPEKSKSRNKKIPTPGQYI